jgi:hypothetical protein
MTNHDSKYVLTAEEFSDRYPLVRNHLNASAGWAVDAGRGCLFSPYGEELEFIRGLDPRRVWTLVEGVTGKLALLSGVHAVQRLGYLVSTTLAPEGVLVYVAVDDGTDRHERELLSDRWTNEISPRLQ